MTLIDKWIKGKVSVLVLTFQLLHDNLKKTQPKLSKKKLSRAATFQGHDKGWM